MDPINAVFQLECGAAATLPGHYAAAAEKLFPRWRGKEAPPAAACDDACPPGRLLLLHACGDDGMDVPGASGAGEEEATGAPTRARDRAQHSGVAHATERTSSARA
ncbi:hypothetical protein MRX96_006656 [Rhipicephalus microplus]